VGRGKEVPFDKLVSLSQGNTGLVVSEEVFGGRVQEYITVKTPLPRAQFRPTRK